LIGFNGTSAQNWPLANAHLHALHTADTLV